MPASSTIEVRGLEPGEDRTEVDAFLEERSALRVARLGELIDARDHPVLIARERGRLVGALTYVLDGDGCEVLTLHAAEPRRGVGRALMGEVERLAGSAGCHRLWLITTNDNLDALRFYQRVGFRLVGLHAGAVGESRRSLKPEIPAIGEYGIVLEDELELHKRL